MSIVVLGPDGVGKTALVNNFVYGRFIELYHRHTEDLYGRDIVVDNKTYFLEIVNIAISERFACMRDRCIESGEGFILVFSLTDRNTFQDITNARQMINNFKWGRKVPLIIVGNKVDLQQQRDAPASLGRDLGFEWDCPYFEASAKDGTNVKNIFAEVVREMKNNLKKGTKRYSSCSLL